MSTAIMVCNNCGGIDSGKAGTMYECPACGWGDGWGAEDRADAARFAARIHERGRLDEDATYKRGDRVWVIAENCAGIVCGSFAGPVSGRVVYEIQGRDSGYYADELSAAPFCPESAA